MTMPTKPASPAKIGLITCASLLGCGGLLFAFMVVTGPAMAPYAFTRDQVSFDHVSIKGDQLEAGYFEGRDGAHVTGFKILKNSQQATSPHGVQQVQAVDNNHLRIGGMTFEIVRSYDLGHPDSRSFRSWSEGSEVSINLFETRDMDLSLAQQAQDGRLSLLMETATYGNLVAIHK